MSSASASSGWPGGGVRSATESSYACDHAASINASRLPKWRSRVLTVTPARSATAASVTENERSALNVSIHAVRIVSRVADFVTARVPMSYLRAFIVVRPPPYLMSIEMYTKCVIDVHSDGRQSSLPVTRCYLVSGHTG